jgi:hypothetical protein
MIQGIARVTILATAMVACNGSNRLTEVPDQPGLPNPAMSHVAAATAIDLGYGPDLFYYLRHDPADADFSTFGTIATTGAITDRFGVGPNFHSLTFAANDAGYGPNLFYYLRTDPGNGFSTFGTIATPGAITDRFGVGNTFNALTFAAPDLGYGPNLFYYLRRDPGSGFSTFGTISPDGTITDRFGVGTNFDALVFVANDVGYGPNLFYYLRTDPGNGFSTFGTISTSGAIIDRFGVGPHFHALAFAAADLGYGPDQFHFLRHDPADNNFATFGTISTSGVVTDRFGVGNHVDALAFAVGADEAPPMVVQIDIRPGTFPNTINIGGNSKLPVAILSSEQFDAATVDASTVRFGRTGTEATPLRHTLSYVNDDLRLDLLLHFETQATGIVCGTTSASLTGHTTTGAAIAGSDAVVVTGCQGA